MSQAGILNVSGTPSVPTSFVTDSGTAVPAANVLNVVTPGSGTEGIETTGSGNTITITLTNTGIASTTTVGASSSTFTSFPIPVPASSVVSVRANIACYDPTNNLAAALELLGGMKNVGGVLTVISSVDVTKNTDAALNNVTANLTSSGANCLVQVTGVAAHNLDWKAIIEYVGAS